MAEGEAELAGKIRQAWSNDPTVDDGIGSSLILQFWGGELSMIVYPGKISSSFHPCKGKSNNKHTKPLRSSKCVFSPPARARVSRF
jgi:hypothetical protein